MNEIMRRIQGFDTGYLKLLVKQYEQFEIAGVIGDCELRQEARKIVDLYYNTSGAAPMWMERIAFETYRELSKRWRPADE